MKFKPFYVSTEGITAKQAQDLFNLAVKNGAIGVEAVIGEVSQYRPLCTVDIDLYELIGVCNLQSTYALMSEVDYGEEAVELTYEQALDHVKGVATKSLPDPRTQEGYKEEDMDFLHITKPVEKSKLRVTKERPTSGQFIATWICNGEPWSFTFKWVNNTLYIVDERSYNYWSESRETFDFETEVWYTIIK